MAGWFRGTYGLFLVAFGWGKLSRLRFVIGGNFQLASMNFRIDT